MNAKRWRRKLVLALVVAPVFIGRAAFALEGSAIDGDARTTVALTEGDDAATSVLRCTGVLVAPNLVLTARHCITERVPDTLGCGHDVEGPVRLDARRTWVTTATAATRGATFVRGASWSLPASTSICGHDIALLTLEEAVRDRDALARAVEPEFDEDAVVREASASGVTLVGYGASSPEAVDRGVRRRRAGAALVCAGGRDSCRAYGEPLAPSELLIEASACPGDSGGGAFVGEPARVAGVLSRTLAQSGSCGMAIFSTLGAHALLFARTARAAAALIGSEPPAWVAEAEARGNAPGDAPRALGAPCDADDDCTSGACRSGDRAATFVCATSCASNCGAGSECRRARAPDGHEDDACLAAAPPPTAGCAIGGASDAFGASAALVLVVLVVRALRRRRVQRHHQARQARPRFSKGLSSSEDVYGDVPSS